MTLVNYTGNSILFSFNFFNILVNINIILSTRVNPLPVIDAKGIPVHFKENAGSTICMITDS